MNGICEWCGVEYEKKSNSQKYCDDCKPTKKTQYKSLQNELNRQKKRDPYAWLKNINADLKAGKYHGGGGAAVTSKNPWFRER